MPKMAKIVVDVGEQMNGITFRLSPKTRAFLSSRLTKIAPPSSVFVSHETASNFENYPGPLWEHVAMILTGLSEKKLKELGGFEFVTPVGGKVWFESAVR
ncbi:MAG TPA: hypothetical protein VKM93_15790 [Terriglobia bacterium]|nr:hypothetical protein [Terriglobia bacterium]